MTPRGGALGIEVVTIGDELLLGFTVDTNAAYLARSLADLGIPIVRRSTVGDGADAIAGAVAEALDRAGAVITTGGLGPTSDDKTKFAIAALFGRTMQLDAELLARMQERWARRFERPMPESNQWQAMIPDGAVVLTNNHGSAPGIWLEDGDGRWVAMLPGVPREMRGMLDDTLIPRLRQRILGSAVVRSKTLRTTGIPESLLADKIQADATTAGIADLAYLPSVDGVDLRVTVRGQPARVADEQLSGAIADLRRVVSDAAYGEDGTDLAAVVLDLCRSRSLTLAVAESCTGGLLGARLTSVPGASDVVRGGVIAYHDDVKRGLLEVDADTLATQGAVSEPVVRQMAAAARRLTGAAIGLAITGIAGPTGGTPDKPVGTVWIAVDVSGRAEARLLRLFGDREEVRRRSAQASLDLARRLLDRSLLAQPGP